jgi:cysteinyl-tRNA synthetase
MAIEGVKIFNTLTGQKEELVRPRGRSLKLFVCGPTVYDYPHIGNARTFLNFDMFVKFLRVAGYDVNYLQNITDIDDKIINRAKEEKTTWDAISRKYEREYLMNMRTLGIDSVNIYAKATGYIPQIISQVKTLIKKERAYLIEGDGYYFDLATFPEYGKLSRRTTEQAEDAVSRIDTSDKKRNRGDFALWKFSKPNEPGWKTELGYGRPGWHIEDTAITEYFFGPQYDLHGGAQDLKFPHHEAEIAQQESASGKKPFVKQWMHSGFLTVNGEKMSKSLNNFVSVKDFLKKYPPELLRMIVFMHHYRAPMDYSDALVSTAQKNLNDIAIFLAKIKKSSGKISEIPTGEFLHSFFESLKDDFNTPKALAAVFELMSKVQPNIWDLSWKARQKLTETIEEALKIVGIHIPPQKISLKVKLLALRRERYRKNKQFIQSDALRKKIDELGYITEDTPKGPLLFKPIYVTRTPKNSSE